MMLVGAETEIILSGRFFTNKVKKLFEGNAQVQSTRTTFFGNYLYTS